MSPNQKLPVRFRHGLHGLLDEWFSQGSAKSRSQYNMLTWKKRAISNVYADPAKEREKGVRAGAEAVRKSAWDAFRAQCPHIAFPYGKEFPMCDDHEQDHPMRDCILQCEKGRIFKGILK